MKKSILLLLVLCLSIPLTPFFLASGTAVADAPVDVELISVDFRPSPTVGEVFVMTPRVKNISDTQDYHVKAVFGYAFDRDKYDCPLEWPYDVNKYPKSPSTQSQEIDWANYEYWEQEFPFETPLLEPVFETPVPRFAVVDLPLLLGTDMDASPGQYNVPYVIFCREWTDENGDGKCDASDTYGDWQHISRLKTLDLSPREGQDAFVDVVGTVLWVDLDDDRELDWVGQDQDGNWNDDANENGYMDPGEGEVRGAIDPGESFYVTLRVKNKGTYAATNIQVKLAYEETRPEETAEMVKTVIFDLLEAFTGLDLSALAGQAAQSEYQSGMPFTPVGDSVEFIQDLEPGQEAEAVFSVKATSSAESDIHSVPVSILFQNAAGKDEVAVKNIVGIEVRGTPRFEIAGVTTDPSTVRAGDRYTIEIQLENIGTQAARSVSVRLFVGGEEVAQEQFLGSMEPGSIGIAIFDAKAGQEGLTELGVEIDYLQESDGVLTPVTVQARNVKLDVLPEAGISTLTWVLVALVVIAAVVLGIVLWRRRSKGEEDEGEWGGPQDGLWGGGPQNKEWMARAEGEKAGAAQSDVVASHAEESVAGLAAETACSTDEASTETYRVRIVKPKETPAPVVIGEPLMQPIQYEEEEAEGSLEKQGRLRRMFGWMKPRMPFKRSAVAESAEVAEPVVIEEPLVQPVQYEEEEAEGSPEKQGRLGWMFGWMKPRMPFKRSAVAESAEVAEPVVIEEPVVQVVQYEEEGAESSTEKRGKLRRMSSWMRSKRLFIISWENVPWAHDGTEVGTPDPENGAQWSPNSRIGGLAKDRLLRQEVGTDNPDGEVAAG